MAREPKPWQRGYIPTVGKRRGAGWTAPEAPPGWYRLPRTDKAEYMWGGRGQYWTPTFLNATIIGGVGLPWRLFRRLGEGPVFESHSFQTVIMWWSIEQSNQPEPEPEQEYTFAGNYRQQGKLHALSMAYGAGAQQLAAYKQLLNMDFAKVEQRVAAMCHDELAVYCQADVKAEAMAAEDIYADFAKNYKGSKP